MMTFTSLDQVLQALLIAVISVLAGGLVLLLSHFFAYLKEKTANIKNATLRNVLYTAETEAENVTNLIVSSLNQTVVGDLKEQNGGKLSPADVKRIKDQALSEVKKILSDEAQSVLSAHKGDIEGFLTHLLEDAVRTQKSDTNNIAVASLRPFPTA